MNILIIHLRIHKFFRLIHLLFIYKNDGNNLFVLIIQHELCEHVHWLERLMSSDVTEWRSSRLY